MPECASARGEQADPQFFVRRSAGAEDRDPGPGVGPHHAHLVGPPVADRPQRIGVAPQELGADRVQRLAVLTDPAAVLGGVRARAAVGPRSRCAGASGRGGAAPSHQPPHRRLHRLWTTAAPSERFTCCHEERAVEEGDAAQDPTSAPARAPPCRPGRLCELPRVKRRSPRAPPRVRRECAPDTLPQNAPSALDFHGERRIRRRNTGSIFSQIPRVEPPFKQVRTRSVTLAPSTRRVGPGGGERLPDRSAARGDCGGGVPQPTGSSTAGRPTHRPWKRSPGGRSRAHGRAHGHTSGARRNRAYGDPHFRTDHNPANRKNAP